jgi:hypothetical protein
LDNGGGKSRKDLRQTIAGLRRSLMAHAKSSAKSKERLSRVFSEHNTLLQEHLALQEQMDNAVELLKYLKEEKCDYDGRISKLCAQVHKLRDAAKENIMSVTMCVCACPLVMRGGTVKHVLTSTSFSPNDIPSILGPSSTTPPDPLGGL